MKLKNIIYTTLGCLLLVTSCDDIAESDRRIEVQTVASQRAVLIEEFCGQLCINCPDGAEELEKIQKGYGADSVIIVSIHSGVSQNLAVPTSNTKAVGLATDYGEALYQKNGVSAEPSIIVDRNSGVLQNRSTWATAVGTALHQSSSVSLKATSAYSSANDSLIITIHAKSIADISGTLQVWLTEDNIIAIQKLSNGYDYNHVFNHVFRACVNGDGSSISLKGSDKDGKTLVFRTKIDTAAKWKAANMSVVAFIQDGNGVQQSTINKITQ